jgi:ribosome-associated heat shock protein Hsp15
LTIAAAASLAPAERANSKTRLDQWLWFARFVKSRSLAARLCAAGAVSLNGSVVGKASQTVRVGDEVALVLRGWQRTVRVAVLGTRRGPAPEARLLYEEVAAATRLSEPTPAWVPLLDDGDAAAAAAITAVRPST